MLSHRVIPCLLLKAGGLVKTVHFKDPTYVGDPINAVKIFNDKEVDELLFVDIMATTEGRRPPFDMVADIASECFMPLSYGGGIGTLDDMEQLFELGVEKVMVNTQAVEQPELVREAAERFGSQSVVVSIDVKKKFLGGYEVHTRGGRKGTGLDPERHAARMAELGAGEVLVNSIDRDGTMQGYDLALVRAVSAAVQVPVIACGGAGTVEHLASAIREGGASAASAGSMFVFHGRHRAVLISYPPPEALREALG